MQKLVYSRVRGKLSLGGPLTGKKKLGGIQLERFLEKIQSGSCMPRHRRKISGILGKRHWAERWGGGVTKTQEKRLRKDL